MGGKQLGFGDDEQTTARKRTMEAFIPWKALIEVSTMRRFAAIDLTSERIPDETTILSFRHLLERQDLSKQIYETVKAHFNA
jgi:IS5 family transposase